jgi:cytochrome c peroxidase
MLESLRYIRNKFIFFSFSILIIIAFFSSFKKDTKPTKYHFVYDTLRFNKPVIPENNPTTIEGIELGRLLFYDPILSYNNSVSCGSCHKQEFSFSDGGNVYSKGADGNNGKRNTMSLVNLLWQTSFFWDGRAKTLEDVIFFPVTDNLEMADDTNNVVNKLKSHKFYPTLFKKAFPDEEINFNNTSKAIAQFLRTIYIQSYSPEFFQMISKVKKNESPELLNENSFAGMYFRTINTCGRCHPGEGMGDTKFADNLITENDTNSRYYVTGLSADISKFKVPSLINIITTAPYMHDGRFKNISDLVEHYDKHLKDIAKKNPDIFGHVDSATIVLSDKQNFNDFFELFTDSAILTSKKFSNPFLSSKFNWNDFPEFR